MADVTPDVAAGPPHQSVCIVTGANGFIGRALCATAVAHGYRVRGAVRRSTCHLPCGVEPALVGDLASDTNWAKVLDGGYAIVHTAARVHVMQDSVADPLAEFRRVNVAGTLRLARQAANAGVRRFLFISSIKVNGAETFDVPFTADDTPAPDSPYAISKQEAELGLRQIAEETGLEVVTIRPPLVFGPGASGNFDALLRHVARGVPLPLGAIHNQRSLVALDNLVDLMMTCLHHPAAPNQVFLVSDGEDLSTTALLRRTAAALGRPARLIPVPARVLRAAARVSGQTDLAQRLCGSLQVSITKTRERLGWAPMVTVDQALSQVARHFLANRHR
jgi:nucleoside-diphosphate-sugar epimerase